MAMTTAKVFQSPSKPTTKIQAPTLLNDFCWSHLSWLQMHTEAIAIAETAMTKITSHVLQPERI